MPEIVRYPTSERLRSRYGSLAGARTPPPGRSWRPSRLVSVAVWVAIAAFAVGVHQLAQSGTFSRLLDVVAPSATETVAATAADTLVGTFSLCGSGRRVDCVVDGDTFWHRGVKIRIADIDTPELSPPRCEAERVKGEAAKRRLQALLNAGPFSLTTSGRDEDRYGRKLRSVRRGGVSFGDVLIREGLARRWDGARRPWCG
jgi:endonuclease YncB( thermonuclease family)